MAQKAFSAKKIQIDKANYVIVLVMSIACFVTIFSLVASKSLLEQRSYQARVIDKKEAARDVLEANLKTRDQLVTKYKVFVENPTNAIGGSSTGKAEKDGDNAVLILDSLPSQYDFPAVATSIEKLALTSLMDIKNISGTDNEIEQSGANTDSSVAVEIPFDLTVEGETAQLQSLLVLMDRSIRPFAVRKMTITASGTRLNALISGVTFYQPEKTLQERTEVER